MGEDRAAKAMTTPVPEHGTRARYQGSRTRKPCRCELCTEANKLYNREKRNGGAAPVAQHGTRSCYNTGCRRPECVQANRDYQREWARVNVGGHLWDQPRKYVRKKPLNPPAPVVSTTTQETQT